MSNEASSKKVIELEAGWNEEIKAKALDPLEDMIEKGMKNNTKLFPNKEYAGIYTLCYDMCTQRPPYNWSQQIYERHGETLSQYLTNRVLPALQQKSEKFLLEELVKRGENHIMMNKWMKQFFMYLDRYYVKYHNLPSLEEAGLQHFKNLVFDEVKSSVATAILDLINTERDGTAIEHDIVRQSVMLFESMGLGRLDVYVNDFEKFLLENTKDYYTRKAESWLQNDDTPAYLVKAEKALEEEKKRVKNYLHPDTEPKILSVVEEEALGNHISLLLEKEGSGCKVLLMNDKLEDLSRMFRLFALVPHGLPPMADVFKSHICDLGQEKLEARKTRLESQKEKETNEDMEYIKDLIALHEKYIALIESCFESHALFQKALKEAFQDIVNKDSGKFKTADLMSSFCDRILKTGSNMSDEEIESNLDKTVQLFGYLHDKDLFAEMYRNQLSKRLLNQRSASDEMEKSMIGKLKLKCGAQFTTKMEGMLNDLSIGVEHEKTFTEYFKEKASQLGLGKTEFTIQVLTTGHWPNHKVYDLALPSVMAKCVQSFDDFYTVNNNMKKLGWYHGLGNATIKGTFGRRAFDLQVTTLQAILLLEFNDESVPTISFNDLAERTRMDPETLKRVMHSLSCGKYKVIKKISEKTDAKEGDKKEKAIVKPTDSFMFNDAFTCQMKRIRIPMASLEETANTKRVEEDRTIAIEACIVRIMKARKTLGHQQLTSEVLNQLSTFRPDPKVIKKRIESLIDRDYLERDGAAGSYKYLA